MKTKLFLVICLIAGLQVVNADADDDHDDDDDDDGQPHYCPKDNGMFPNPTDCSTYYNCVDGTAIPMSCAPGLLFDPDTKMCNFPDQTKCKNECRGPNGLFPSQDRCDEFILCTNNKPEKKRCKKGLYFDANLQVCNYKGQVLCSLPGGGKKKKKQSGKKKKTYKHNNDDDDDHDDSDEKKPKKEKSTKGSVKVGQYVVGSDVYMLQGTALRKGHQDLAAASVRSVCPKPRGLFAHAESCSTFYQCYDGEVLVKSCPAGLLFDEYRHMCAYGKEVDCGGRRLTEHYDP